MIRPAKRNYATALFSLLLLFALSSQVSAEKITVMVNAAAANEYFDEAVGIFEDRTGIEVESLVFTGWASLVEKLPTMAAGGVSPDVVFHDKAGAQGDLVGNGLMMPIEDFIKRDNLDLSIWPSSLVDAHRFGGVLYSLPAGVSQYSTYYNADKLSSMGIPELPTDWMSTEFTFDDMVEYGHKLTVDRNGDGSAEEVGLSDFFAAGENAISLWQLYWLNEEQTEFIGNSPEHAEAIRRIAELYASNIAGPGLNQFLSGNVGIHFNQPWIINRIKSQMEEGGLFTWKLAVNPKAECRCSVASFLSWGIPAAADNPEAAWEFAKFMSLDPEGARLWSYALNRTPVLPDLFEEFAWRWEQINPGMNADVLTASIPYLWEKRVSGLPINIANTIRSKLREVYGGATAPESALAALEPVINALLDEYHTKR